MMLKAPRLVCADRAQKETKDKVPGTAKREDGACGGAAQGWEETRWLAGACVAHAPERSRKKRPGTWAPCAGHSLSLCVFLFRMFAFKNPTVVI